MKYKNITKAKFIKRPNRFIAHVEVLGDELVVHVKNTGRCKELLIPGCTVYLEKAANPERKTPYDLVAVEKDGRIINIDSQAPNQVVKEFLMSQKQYSYIKPEYKYGKSRVDFYMEKKSEKYLMEVKGCTLFRDGVGYFPDAPTERGAKHLRELIDAKREGYHARIAFVIQGEGIREVRPNTETDPEFTKAFIEARAAGVEVVFYLCRVTADELEIIEESG
ncbi:DNA/RNA nuclease SfsA [Butyrivibrio sp. INlla14]|uniref:DNA/RNA nuclease SfsA n=1 Tax=Butyrivibrio sp. INlla14 TaxID=1520808 RepID=UPI000875F5FC|nr:DNA/RNA nuclease SfsA [Butyrivibrio sp. INlla14]SCY42432.1 sugar fermentation stimulation protein A [Butyrivibrio sp. INlla14]